VFWQEVAVDPDFAGQFNDTNQKLMSDGRAPFAPKLEVVGGRERFEIDHTDPLFRGGDVYNTDNLSVMTPRAHIEKSKND